MSIGPSSHLAGSAAATPAARSSSAEQDRAAQEFNSQMRQVTGEKKAANAAGIGETDAENNEASDRDPDGRRLLEESPRAEKQTESGDDDAAPQAKDASGESGTLLDLSG